MQAHIDRYADRGDSGFANLVLPSGERAFLSLSPKGLRVHNLILWGRIPGRTLHIADAAAVARMVKVLARGVETLPKLPDNAAMDSFLVTAAQALRDPGVYSRYAPDEDGHPITTLALLTRAVLDAADQADVVRRLSRAAATPG